MTPPDVSQIDFVQLLKYGAIGISLVCLLTAFWNNQSLTLKASTIPPETLDRLLAHARWTMKFSFACLIAAILIEGISHFSAPITVRVSVVPSNLDSDLQRIRTLKVIGEPVRIQVGSEARDIELKNGTGQIQVGPNTTLLVYVDGMWSAFKDLDGIAYGQQQHSLGTAGVLEPKP